MSQKTYRIGEAAAKLNLKSYVLRFWETEFPQIAPLRTEKGQRLYTESDLAVLGRIRYLLHERGLTIDGARRLLREAAARGTLYTGADILSNGGMAEEDAADNFGDEGQAAGGGHTEGSPGGDFKDGPDGDFEGGHIGGASSPADGRRVPEETGTLGSAARGPAQASLFPPETGSGAMNRTELRGIVAELEAIRRLLVHDGETP